MPSLSQSFESSEDNSSRDRQGLSPIQRKSTSASSIASRRDGVHLRSKSDSSVRSFRSDTTVRHSSNGSSSNNSALHSPRSDGFSTRTSHYHRNCIGPGHGAHASNGRPESYEARYERYRHTYLATSAERELESLSADLVNVRKWVKTKYQCLQTLQQSPQALAKRARESGQATQSPKESPQVQGRKTNSRRETDTPSNKRQAEDNHRTRLEKLVTEAGHQQKAVDVLLDRGRRYLTQRACVTLEVDLDNLAFLWASYTKQLYVLRDRLNNDISSDFHLQKHLGEGFEQNGHISNGPLSDSPLQNGGVADVSRELDDGGLSSGNLEGKENCHTVLHSTPVKWKNTAAKVSSSPFSRGFSDRQKHHRASFSYEKTDLPRISAKVSSSITSNVVDSASNYSEKRNLSAEKRNLDSSLAESATSAKSGTTFAAQQNKKARSAVQPSANKAPVVTGAARVKKLGGGPKTTSKGTDSTAKSLAKNPTGDKNRIGPKKAQRVLPQTPSGKKHHNVNGAETVRVAQVDPVNAWKPPQQGNQTSDDQTSPKEEETNLETEKTTEEREISHSILSSVPSSQENPSPIRTEEKEANYTEEEKRSSPRSERARIISVSFWPAPTTNGWLKVPGEGIFSSPTPRRSLEKPRLSFFSNPAHNTESLSFLPEVGDSPKASSAAGCSHSFSSPINKGNRGNQSSAATGEGLLGKRSKEIHNEKHQQQFHAGDKIQGAEGGVGCNALPSCQLQLGLTASEEEEYQKMEIEEALKEIHVGPLLASATSLDTELPELDQAFKNARTTPTRSTPVRDYVMDSGSHKSLSREHLSLDELDLPTGPKRRRMNTDTPSSCSGSPYISGDSSLNCTPTESPAGTLRKGELKQRYKKDELWKAIESNYKYLMDKEIIETCQSTGGGVSEEEVENEVPNVSFAEFLEHYQELIDWLNQAQRNTQRIVNSLSEKYLNQTYHEEMLEKSPCRDFLNKYAEKLLQRYPSLRDQVNVRLQRLHGQWQVVVAAIGPHRNPLDTQIMLQEAGDRSRPPAEGSRRSA